MHQTVKKPARTGTNPSPTFSARFHEGRLGFGQVISVSIKEANINHNFTRGKNGPKSGCAQATTVFKSTMWFVTLNSQWMCEVLQVSVKPWSSPTEVVSHSLSSHTILPLGKPDRPSKRFVSRDYISKWLTNASEPDTLKRGGEGRGFRSKLEPAIPLHLNYLWSHPNWNRLLQQMCSDMRNSLQRC